MTKWRRTMRKTLNLETPGATVATPSERRDRRRAAHLSDVSATTRPTVDSFTPNDRQGGEGIKGDADAKFNLVHNSDVARSSKSNQIFFSSSKMFLFLFALKSCEKSLN